MIRIFLGNLGCLGFETRVLTNNGYKRMIDLSLFDKIGCLDNQGNVIFSDAIMTDAGMQKVSELSINNKKIFATSNHTWLCHKDGKIKEIKTDNLNGEDVLHAAKLEAAGKRQHIMERRFRHGLDKRIIFSKSANPKNIKNIKLCCNSNNAPIETDEHSKAQCSRISVLRGKARNLEKRIIREKKSLMQTWQMHRIKEQSKILFSIQRQNMRSMQKDIRRDNDAITSYRHEQQEQQSIKSDDTMPILSCKTAHCYKTQKSMQTFDMHIEGFNNFIIEDGLITHNSGKTISAVREMYISNRKYYSNIATNGIKNNTLISKDMIIKQEVISQKRNGEPVYKSKLNAEFWQDNKTMYGLNVVLDEAHTILNARRSNSTRNIIATEFIALLRRVVSGSGFGSGSLTLISQLDNRIDIIARDMCNQVLYHKCYFRKICTQCHTYWNESSDTPNPLWDCPSCNSMKIVKRNAIIEVHAFSSMDAFMLWKFRGQKTYYARYYMKNIEKYFSMYNTLQWENLFD